MLSIKMGLRNLKRNLRRSIFTGLIMLFGTALVVWMAGLNDGQYFTIIEMVSKTYNGHLQILHSDYNDKPSMFKNVDNPETIISSLRKQEHVVGVSGRVETAGLLAAGKRTTGVMLQAVDPINEPKVTTMANTIREGTWLPTGELALPEDDAAEGELSDEDSMVARLPIVLGKGVARRLRTKLGDEVSFIGQAADGSTAAELFRVVGIYGSGNELDGAIAIVRLKDAQSMLALGNQVHRVVVAIDESVNLEKTKTSIASQSWLDGDLGVHDWRTLVPGLEKFMETDQGNTIVFIFFILSMVLLGVMNTMLMSVFERTREFGIMLAVGTSPGRIVSFTLWEVIWLSVIGVGLGTLMGTLIVEYVAIPLGEELEFAGVSFSEMSGVNMVTNTVVYPLVVLVGSILSGLYPSLRAARLKPVEAIRGG